MRTHDTDAERNSGPGLFFILAALVVVAVVGARFLGFSPAEGLKGIIASRTATPVATTAKPLVAIYHSHTTERYAPGESHARGEAGDIVNVGRTFKAALEERGILAVHSETVHDYPVFKDAYDNSLETVSEQLAQNGSIQMVFDVHRDGLPPESPVSATSVDVDGQRVARILFVVGDTDNPHFQENLAFAQNLDARLNELHPGVSRGVKVEHGTFNERVAPQATAAFVGSYPQTKLDEADRAAKLLADAVAALISRPAPAVER